MKCARVGGALLCRSVLVLVTLASVVRPVRSEAQDVEQLQKELTQAFDSYAWGDAQWGALVYSLDSGDTLFAIAPDSALAPASNMKLLTTAAALHRLGPDYRFHTYLLSDATVRDGALKGNLTIFGTGDPGISDRFFGRKDEVFQRLIDQLESAGISEISGDLVADASFFPGPLRSEGWEPEDLNEHFTAGVSALSFNENVVSFRIRPSGAGSPPLVETIPPHSALEVRNDAMTVSGRARPRLAILREDPLGPVRITGRLAQNSRDVWRQMTVAVPADFVGASFRAALEGRGITVRGETRRVELPVESVVKRLSAPALNRPGARILARHTSQPLSEYLAVVNKESNNLFSELIFRAVGRADSGLGSPHASSEAVRGSLLALGIDTSGLQQYDGSGLSSENRVSAATFVDLFRRMSAGPFWPPFWASLPRAGTRGELGRMYRSAAAGNLRAKTGTIEGVSALSGVVRSRDGERLAFSLIVNDSPSQTRAKRVENEIGVRLANFQRSPGTAPPVYQETADMSSTAVSTADRHRVSRGESLSGIALRYGVSVDDLLELNPRLDRNRIFAGQWLTISRRGGD